MENEESFEVRVKRLFGAQLFESVPNGVLPSSSWSVASGEVERVVWDRSSAGDGDDRRPREEIPCASAFFDDGCFSKKNRNPRDSKKKNNDFEGDADELDDDGDEDERGRDEEDGEREEKNIRSSVGLDPTLDNEEEEDQYDRAAFLRDDNVERVYMRDIKDPGRHLNFHSIVSDSFEDPFERIHLPDPRADHLAARLRLKEDDEASGGARDTMESPGKKSEAKICLKPILKRKESPADSRPKKHVRFNPNCREEDPDTPFEEAENAAHIVPCAAEDDTFVGPGDGSLPFEATPGVPDYLRNPSKYTRYTFDADDHFDNRSNNKAFQDFRDLVKGKNSEIASTEPGTGPSLPASIIFSAPRKAASKLTSEACGLANGAKSGQTFTVIAEEGVQEMEETDRTTLSAGRGKEYRKYRPRQTSE